MDHASEYSRKVVSPEEAVRAVKSGDWVQYGHHANAPVYLDGFLARRKDELRDVKVCAVVFPGLAQVATCDPGREHFIYSSWHSALASASSRTGDCAITFPSSTTRAGCISSAISGPTSR